MNEERRLGEQYRHQYEARGEPASDSPAFRYRVFFYLTDEEGGGLGSVVTRAILARDFGIPSTTRQSVQEVFQSTPVSTLMSVITAALREYVNKIGTGDTRMTDYYIKRGKAFLHFIRTALREEHLAYEVDDRGGVHPFVDPEFARNRGAALADLALDRYSNVREGVASAFARLTVSSPNNKTAIPDVFTAAESLFKLILTPRAPSLTLSSVKSHLQPLVDRLYSSTHSSVKQTAAQTCASFGNWVDACHPYRHGQPSTEAILPPPELTILLLSQGASFIRWLVSLDKSALQRELQSQT